MGLPAARKQSRLARCLAAGATPHLCAAMAACSASSGIPGLPTPEFARSFAAGLDVAAAERCGESVDAGLVRYNLVEYGKRSGLPAHQAEKAGLAFDKTRSEYAHKLAADPAYCTRDHTPTQERLALYQKGEFPDPP